MLSHRHIKTGIMRMAAKIQVLGPQTHLWTQSARTGKLNVLLGLMKLFIGVKNVLLGEEIRSHFKGFLIKFGTMETSQTVLFRCKGR